MCESEVNGRIQAGGVNVEAIRMWIVFKNMNMAPVVRVNASREEVGRLGPRALQCLEVHLAPESQFGARFYSGDRIFYSIVRYWFNPSHLFN